MSAPADMNRRAADPQALVREIVRLMSQASIEANVQDARQLEDAHRYLPPGTRVYVSHLPGQRWSATADMCRAVLETGFEPIPHLPVRLLKSAADLHSVLSSFAACPGLREALVIAGDYAEPGGPYQCTEQVIATGALEQHGLSAISVAGHPEGNPKVPEAETRAAERRKPALARAHGLNPTIITQFVFESEPFCRWSQQLRADGVTAALVCGLAGPARITTLFRYAMRCGVGPSIRALGARPSVALKLLEEFGPDRVLRGLATENLAGTGDTTAVHMFGFGGFLKTAEWMSRVSSGAVELNDSGGFAT